MALAHSPKIVTDGLVFMYDTGDGKSYKGEPTTNLITNSGTSNTGWVGYGWTGSQAISNDYPNTYEFTATNGWHNRTFDTGVTSGGTIYVSFQYKLKQQQTSQNQIFVLNGTHLGSYTNYIGNGSMSFEWQTFSGSFTANANSSKIAIGPRGQDSSGLTDIVYIRNLQVEQKPHATPFVNGTRSATQGLLDRTGNTTIDLSNASFDSSAQMTFDGTDDIINTGLFSGRNPSTDPFTVEAVVRSNVTSGNKIWIDATSNGSNQRFYSALIDSTSHAIGIQGSAWSDPVPSDTNWHHQVIVMDGSTAKAYNNGELASSKSYTSYTLAGGLNIGGRSGYRWVGQIPIFKLYNKALTASEVLQNYNATKSRFL